MTSAYFVSGEELARVRGLEASLERKVALFADVCRINVLAMVMTAGSGHLGTSFSCIDIVSWLFLSEGLADGDASRPRYFSSKGHDAPAQYAVLAGVGLMDAALLRRLRRLGGLPGHPDVGTPGIETNTGSLGMGISKARGFVLADRLRGTPRTVYVLTGDGELQEGQFWESLQPAANAAMGEIVAIVDHNKVQSDTFVERVSGLGDLEARLRAHGWGVARCDGHDSRALQDAVRSIRRPDRPAIVIADTIKGRGVSFMEHTAMAPDQRLYRYHSGAPDPEAYALALAELRARVDAALASVGQPALQLEAEPVPARSVPPSAQRLVAAYGAALVEEAERDARIVAFDADLALDTGLLPFETRFPERFFEFGIAEQDMVSAAGALALQGFVPAAHSFACFLSSRPNEQIYNNATERRKVVYVASLAGLLPAGPGHSHQSVRDIGAVGSMPGLVLLEPADEVETREAVRYAFRDARSSVYLRLVSIPCEIPFALPDDHTLLEGRGTLLVEGGDAVLFGYGPVMLTEAFRASAALRERGLRLAVIDLPWLNRVDPEWLRGTIGTRRLVVTLDDHYVAGGQGQLVAATVASLALAPSPRVLSLGVREIPACGSNDEVLRHHRLDAASIAEDVSAALGG